MQVRIVLRLREQGSAALQALALRRTRFALRRVLGLEPRAEVTLSDAPAGTAPSGKQCEVRLESDGASPVTASSLARDWRAALDAALERAVRRLVSACRRGWQTPRNPRIALQPARIRRQR